MSGSRSLVYVIDDDESMRRSIKRLLKAHGFEAETFPSADEFLCLPRAARPSCLVLDLSLPGMSGIDLQKEMERRNLNLPIVFITGHGDIPTSVEAMKGGAIDFLPKPFSSKALIEAVERAMARARGDEKRRLERTKVERLVGILTPRELEVMKLVIKGMLNKQIASELGTSVKTIKVHRSRVMRKMEAESVAELVRLAEKAGIVVS
jgi:FixJ family two-component response regulator